MFYWESTFTYNNLLKCPRPRKTNYTNLQLTFIYFYLFIIISCTRIKNYLLLDYFPQMAKRICSSWWFFTGAHTILASRLRAPLRARHKNTQVKIYAESLYLKRLRKICSIADAVSQHTVLPNLTNSSSFYTTCIMKSDQIVSGLDIPIKID
jgi:hypothetical protein